MNESTMAERHQMVGRLQAMVGAAQKLEACVGDEERAADRQSMILAGQQQHAAAHPWRRATVEMRDAMAMLGSASRALDRAETILLAMET